MSIPKKKSKLEKLQKLKKTKAQETSEQEETIETETTKNNVNKRQSIYVVAELEIIVNEGVLEMMQDGYGFLRSGDYNI